MDSVFKWFDSIENKSQGKFIQLDIAEIYPSISEEILDNAILFAQQYNDMQTKMKKNIVGNPCHTMIRVLKEENAKSCFNFTMGSFDGAEICELFGIHTLSLMLNKFDKEYAGWYGDDELILLRNMSNQKTDRIQKDMIEVFIDTGFKIEGKTNLNIVYVLDITFHLLDGKFRSYKRPNDQLLYVNILSNLTSQIIKQLPTSISDRLSNNSSNQKVKCQMMNMKKR